MKGAEDLMLMLVLTEAINQLAMAVRVGMFVC